MNRALTMGEATKAVQGYPTQVWVPVEPKPGTKNILGLLHDRRGQAGGGIYFIPGNLASKLLRPAKEQYKIKLGGRTLTLALPDAVLWRNHGGPCEAGGAEYPRVDGESIDGIYRRLLGGQALTGTIEVYGRLYRGPYDYNLSPVAKRLRLDPMNQEFIRGCLPGQKS